MKIRDITAVIESFAPVEWQQDYDNSGLIVGRPDDQIESILLAVDVTEDVIDEAIEMGCDMIISHHPIIFHPLKRFNSSSYVERCVERAIRSDIALYACHTNLDSAPGGMSWRLAQMVGIGDLEPMESIASNGNVGFGVVGTLEHEMDLFEYLKVVQKVLNIKVMRHSDVTQQKIRRVALCTGSGGSLITQAQRSGAQLYITADLKYNDFMMPNPGMSVVDIGHFESEYCAIQILYDILSKNFATFAVRKSGCSRNPINYLV